MTCPSGARRHTFPSSQSPRSILRSMALTVYPVSTFASGSRTYRAGRTVTDLSEEGCPPGRSPRTSVGKFEAIGSAGPPLKFRSIGTDLRRSTASASDAYGDMLRQATAKRNGRGGRIRADSPIAGSLPHRARCSPLRHGATGLDTLHRIASPSLRTCCTNLPINSTIPRPSTGRARGVP